MAGKQKSVRWEPWIERAIWAIAQENGKNFSWTANYLVETKLNGMGYYRKDFEPDMQKIDSEDIRGEASGQNLSMGEKTAILVDIMRKRKNDPLWGSYILSGAGPKKTIEKRNYEGVLAAIRAEGLDPDELLVKETAKKGA